MSMEGGTQTYGAAGPPPFGIDPFLYSEHFDPPRTSARILSYHNAKMRLTVRRIKGGVQ